MTKILNGCCSFTNGTNNSLGINPARLIYLPVFLGRAADGQQTFQVRAPHGITGWAFGMRSVASQSGILIENVKQSGETPDLMMTLPLGQTDNQLGMAWRRWETDRCGVCCLPNAMCITDRSGFDIEYTREGIEDVPGAGVFPPVATPSQFFAVGMVACVVTEDRANCNRDIPGNGGNMNTNLASGGVDGGACFQGLDGDTLNRASARRVEIPISMILDADGARNTYQFRLRKGYGKGRIVGLEFYNKPGQAYITSIKPAGESYDRIGQNPVMIDEVAPDVAALDPDNLAYAINAMQGIDASCFSSENCDACGVDLGCATDRYGVEITAGKGPNNVSDQRGPVALSGRIVVEVEDTRADCTPTGGMVPQNVM